MIAFLFATALATERPVLDIDADTLCPPRGFRSGVAFAPTCDGVALSLARARWSAEMVSWADEVAALHRIEVATCATEASASAARETWWKTQAERPGPKLAPATWFALGAWTGIVTVVLSAVAVRWAGEVPVVAE